MKLSIKGLTTKVGKIISDHAPTILAGVAVAGVVSSVILAHRAGIKAEKLIAEAEEVRRKATLDSVPDNVVEAYNPDQLNKYVEEHSKLSLADKFKITWKSYLPVAISGSLTIAAIISGNCISSKRLAVMATLLSGAESALTQYQDKVEQMFGKGKAQKVKDAINQDVAKKAMEGTAEEDILDTGHGDTIFVDKTTGRRFKSSVEYLRKIQNDINIGLMTGDQATVNDLYYQLNLDGCEVGDMVGWDINKPCRLKFTADLIDEKPIMVVDYEVHPLWYDHEILRRF